MSNRIKMIVLFALLAVAVGFLVYFFIIKPFDLTNNLSFIPSTELVKSFLN